MNTNNIPTYEELTNSPYYYKHHEASRRGYVSRKADAPVPVEPYEGKFGKGYIAVFPRFDTTQYVDIVYYIRKA